MQNVRLMKWRESNKFAFYFRGTNVALRNSGVFCRPSESPVNYNTSMNALESLPAVMLNFVIFVVTIFGRLLAIVRALY